jgi:hypothetical protein
VELARGTVGDRPWATTLATLARRTASGQLTLVAADGKRYAIALSRGMVVAARSPLVADSVARIALTSHLASQAHVAELMKRVAAVPSNDEVDVLAALARMSPSQVTRLRTEVILRRAARTFAIERGEFMFEDQSCLPVHGCEVDIRAVVYQGIRQHVSEPRLDSELRELGGGRFVLEPGAGDELHRYGFCDGEWPILAALREGANLPELEGRYRDIDPRTMRAAIHALVACGTVRVLAVGRTPTPPTLSRTKTNPELAAEAAERAERALKLDRPEAAVVELERACKLVPADVDYRAMYGWALFCAADDKRAIAVFARQVLEQAVHKSRKPYDARFYLGRVERMLGREQEALGHFHAVLLMQPNHREASAEIRVLQARRDRAHVS